MRGPDPTHAARRHPEINACAEKASSACNTINAATTECIGHTIRHAAFAFCPGLLFAQHGLDSLNLRQFRQRYDAVDMDPEPIVVEDGKYHSSAGATAVLDLMLALVEEDFGAEVALRVAQSAVLFLRRPIAPE